ncbi:hypothetical protein [Paenibacillus sp. FSL R5-0519]|uniref:hypothetical protein n=1 Tax=Paenibacillus sp. FSL R5-0519 TaxID=2921648 RepID=UPI0030D8A050
MFSRLDELKGVRGELSISTACRYKRTEQLIIHVDIKGLLSPKTAPLRRLKLNGVVACWENQRLAELALLAIQGLQVCSLRAFRCVGSTEHTAIANAACIVFEAPAVTACHRYAVLGRDGRTFESTMLQSSMVMNGNLFYGNLINKRCTCDCCGK